MIVAGIPLCQCLHDSYDSSGKRVGEKIWGDRRGLLVDGNDHQRCVQQQQRVNDAAETLASRRLQVTVRRHSCVPVRCAVLGCLSYAAGVRSCGGRAYGCKTAYYFLRSIPH